jgi:ferredoxin/flavodoxin---NADP+ reductase
VTGDFIKPLVVVIGAGPAGIYAARNLADAGVEVILLNRDIKPGGLAEYGIYYDKYKMKQGLRKQFRQILDYPQITYYGNVWIGTESCFSLEEIRHLGFDAIMVTVGAQGTKWLGLPGESLSGVYHAKDLVYHYNVLPPFSTEEMHIGKRVALVGAGNVMMDIARWLIRDLKVDEVIAVVRRGPAEVKFDKKEIEGIARNMDLLFLDDEFARVAPVMQAVGQDVEAAKDYILAALPKALEPVSDTKFRFRFLTSPLRMVDDGQGNVCALEVEDNALVIKNGDTRASSLGIKHLLDVDTVVFAIGDKVDDVFGLPVQMNEFVKNPRPRFPIDGLSYESFDPETGNPLEGIFVAGWSRQASSGLVGLARKDGENGAKAILEYLKTIPPKAETGDRGKELYTLLNQACNPLVTRNDLKKLEAYEQAEAERLHLEDFKLKTNEEMLAAMGLA